MLHDKVSEAAIELGKNAPPSIVVGLSILGFPIADWVQLAVLIYTLLQMHVLAKKNLGFYQSLLSWLKEVISGSSSKGK
ncbi:holin superfamily II protein [Ralstonia phage Reminis]|uniref:Holin superfamily II protein n=1 Tax=Ralstonia phage Reminis TaxID=2662139 RepID=A0A5Q2UAJ6_9CAUD|nr:holin superfamily II protein [Ralstonia phage Reminis]